MTFEGKDKLFYSETSYIKFIALYVHLKISNHLRSHSKAIMALDHNRLGLKNKILGKQIRPNLFAFDRFTLQILANKSGGV